MFTLRQLQKGVGISAVALALSATPQPRAQTSPQDGIAGVVEAVRPAVVRIIAVRSSDPSNKRTDPDKIVPDVEQTALGNGSGFIIEPSGFVATNKHVIEGSVAAYVMTADGVRFKARMVGATARADMALLKIEPRAALPTVRLGDSDKMRVGDPVVAIGSPFGFQNTATSGIISAINRDVMESPFDDYIQTDVPTNHGNSGGPLLNLAGEVIGMNSLIYSPVRGWTGITLAIPSNDLRFVFGRLMKTGAIRAGMVPATTQPITWMLQQALGIPVLQGALVSAITDTSQETLAGKLQPGDVIISFNGRAVLDPRDLARKAAEEAIGSDAVLEIYRGSLRLPIHLTIQAWPEIPSTVMKPQGPQVLGLTFEATKQADGSSRVVVASIDPDGTAADASIQKGDIVLAVQQTPVTHPNDATDAIAAQMRAGRAFAAILIQRTDKQLWVALDLPEKANNDLAQQ